MYFLGKIVYLLILNCIFMKNLNFVVEVINDESRIYVIRDVQGRVIKVCSDSSELAQFFHDVEFKS